MPELPEVESIRRMITERIVGRKIVGAIIHLPRIVRSGDLRSLIGATITEVQRHGKYLQIITDVKVDLFAHLKMTGAFLWSEDLNDKPRYIRAALKFKNCSLLYRDIRTLGALWVLPKGTAPWKRMGVDPLTPEFTAARLMELFAKRRLPIKLALMDQTMVAGIGNIYAAEALFAAKIHPARPANSLKTAEWRRLRNAAVRILRASLDFGGTTFRDFKLPDDQAGEFKNFLKVYGKAGKRCPRCRKEIQKIVQANRSTFFCPNCQA